MGLNLEVTWVGPVTIGMLKQFISQAKAGRAASDRPGTYGVSARDGTRATPSARTAPSAIQRRRTCPCGPFWTSRASTGRVGYPTRCLSSLEGTSAGGTARP